MAKKLVWSTVERKVNDLIPREENPRTISAKQLEDLKRNIKRFNLVEVPAIDLDGRILAGHQRVRALQLLGRGDEKIPVRLPSRKLTEAEARRYLVASNALGGSWDFEKLRAFDADLLLDIGVDESVITTAWDDALKTEDDDFDVEKELKRIKKPTVLSGELWQLGPHRLLCGDGTDEGAVRKLVGSDRIDFVDVDPPFSIGWDYNGKNGKYGGSEKDNRSPEEYRVFIHALIKNSIAVSKKDGHYMFWCDERFVGLTEQLFEECGIMVERVCLWAKNNSMPTPKIAFNKATEFAVYGRIGKPYLNNRLENLTTFQNRDLGTGNQLILDLIDLYSIWLVKRLSSTEYQHATQKPVTLYEKSLRRVTRVGDSVLDLCGGSGSLLVACHQLKRKAFLCEMDPIFATLIKNRYEKLTGHKAKRV
ncbi:MAG: DNA modification methylase [Patescibacteria group bacterium]|nr:DNA modification methylase [Patescibacteria group bacterium]